MVTMLEKLYAQSCLPREVAEYLGDRWAIDGDRFVVSCSSPTDAWKAVSAIFPQLQQALLKHQEMLNISSITFELGNGNEWTYPVDMTCPIR
jgi:hypothetical protein